MAVTSEGQRWPFLLSLFATIAAVGYFGVRGQPAEMGIAAVAGGLCMAFANLDKFERFSGGGFSAELRKRIDQTEDAVSQLRDLAVSLAAPVLTLTAAGGRWVGPDFLRERHRIMDRVTTTLQRLQVPQDQIDDAAARFRQYTLIDHAFKVRELASPKTPDARKELAELIDHDGELGVAEVSAFRAVLDRHGLIRPEAEELLADMEHYRTHGAFRRPELWR